MRSGGHAGPGGRAGPDGRAGPGGRPKNAEQKYLQHMPHNFNQDIAKYKSPFKTEGLPEFPRPHRTDDVPGLRRR